MHKKTVVKHQGAWAEVAHRFARDKLAVIGLIIFVALVLMAVFAPFITQYPPDMQDHAAYKQSPSMEHIFGTDTYGRDIFSRCIYGARISLLVGVLSILFAITLGGLLGAVAAFYGGAVDNIIMRMLDILYAIPAILLAIAIAATLGAGFENMLVAIALGNLPGYARIVRASVLTVKANEYVEATQSIGASNARIIFKHIIPNAMAPIIVQGTLGVGISILSCATLSFLGLGIQPPTPEWGSMLATARNHIRQLPYMSIFPGICIMLTVFSLNVIGDGIRDAIDPRLKD